MSTSNPKILKSLIHFVSCFPLFWGYFLEISTPNRNKFWPKTFGSIFAKQRKGNFSIFFASLNIFQLIKFGLFMVIEKYIFAYYWPMLSLFWSMFFYLSLFFGIFLPGFSLGFFIPVSH